MQYRLRTLLTQFSIRDLLWLIAVAAMAASWLREREAMLQMKAEMAAKREADEKLLAQQRAALVRQTQEIERELTLNRRELREMDARVKLSDERYKKLSEIMSRPSYPYEAERGIYFLAPVR
jgi:hypothetical protein